MSVQRRGMFVRNLVGDGNLPPMPYDSANDPPLLTDVEARNLDGRTVRGDAFALGLDGKPVRGDGFALDGKPVRGDAFAKGIGSEEGAPPVPTTTDPATGKPSTVGLTQAQMQAIADALGKSLQDLFGRKTPAPPPPPKKTIIPGVPDAALAAVVILVVLVAAYRVA